MTREQSLEEREVAGRLGLAVTGDTRVQGWGWPRQKASHAAAKPAGSENREISEARGDCSHL